MDRRRIHNYPPIGVSVVVSNIDKEEPTATGEYSTTQSTKGSVKATIWSDEEINLAANSNSLVSKTSKLDLNGNVKYGITLYYSENKSEVIMIEDLAGNQTSVTVTVNNIDKNVEGLGAKTSSALTTNQNQTLTINANERVRVTNLSVLYGTALLNNIKMKVGKLINDNKVNDKLFSLASLEPIAVLADNNTASSDSLTYELSENGTSVIEATDDTNNTDVVLVNANYIDKQAPTITREADIVNEDGSVVVTLSADEEIQYSDDLAGWVLSSDRTTLIKTFENNKTETVVIKDLAGNSVEYLVEVKDVENLEYVVYTETVSGTEQVMVIIKANREIKEPDGWTLLEDGKAIAKIFDKDETEIVTIEDLYGFSEEVDVQFEFEEKNDEDENIEDEVKTEDDTQSNKIMPQTGGYIAFTAILCFTIITIAVIALINYKKKSNIN